MKKHWKLDLFLDQWFQKGSFPFQKMEVEEEEQWSSFHQVGEVELVLKVVGGH